jgi:hypothetical protein
MTEVSIRGDHKCVLSGDARYISFFDMGVFAFSHPEPAKTHDISLPHRMPAISRRFIPAIIKQTNLSDN